MVCEHAGIPSGDRLTGHGVPTCCYCSAFLDVAEDGNSARLSMS
ncbi:hypothetical protein X976_4728 [Burkholderia pseudomallei MSHR7500]|nr:hypothetical protein X976_4728 [Burkholderia pseudomallei MSHR7500]